MSIISKITPTPTADPNILDLHELEFILTSWDVSPDTYEIEV